MSTTKNYYFYNQLSKNIIPRRKTIYSIESEKCLSIHLVLVIHRENSGHDFDDMLYISISTFHIANAYFLQTLRNEHYYLTAKEIS